MRLRTHRASRLLGLVSHRDASRHAGLDRGTLLCLPVIGDHDHVVGIITERDLLPFAIKALKMHDRGLIPARTLPTMRRGTSAALEDGMTLPRRAEPGVTPLETHLREHLAALYPGCRILSITPLAPDTGATKGSTTKAAGYGLPVRVVVAREGGEPLELVWRIASANEFGHDRRSDRAAGAIQAFDDFRAMPSHIAAIDLGVVRGDGSLLSIADSTEHFLITSYAPGTIYADDLRRIAGARAVHDGDLARLDALAHYLAMLHTPLADPVRYRRAVRDLVGSGEGIFGIIDGYPESVPGAAPGRLRAIEESCATWRWRLHDRGDRLTRTHGDFHPFNVVFGEGDTLRLLDASRGGCGDPADDLTAMAVNFLLFAIDEPAAWPHGLSVLWHQWWQRYLALRDDPELLDIAPPFFAWRALVVANPRFYPQLSPHGRDRLLGFAEDLLDDHTLDPHWAEELFR